MTIRFYNTLTRQKEEFIPMKKGTAGLYTCGPTVYDFAHIGNFRTYMFEDVLRRYLKYRGYRVKQVMNLTDVDDKTIRGVKGTDIPLREYTDKYIEAFFEDLDTLNIERAEVYPRAVDHIDDMVRMVKILLNKGIAYRGDDNSIYFSISKFPQYGRLARINPEELKVGARIRHDEYDKENLSDFALWKAWDENDGNVFWETELGKGRPGWHIECSAMSTRYLGDSFDIHTGGVDNLFPHHENEIAQSEAVTGKKFVNYWLHSEHLLVDGGKMAKSKGNFYTLREIMAKGYDPMALRYFYVVNDYRKKLDFTFEGLEIARKTLEKIYDFLRRVRSAEGQGSSEDVTALIEQARTGFMNGFDDDLNAPMAMAEIFTFMGRINSMLDSGNLSRESATAIIDFMLEMDQVLGLKMEEAFVEKGIADEIKNLIDERLRCRKGKNFARADEIRDELTGRGIILMDTPQGTRWKVKV